MLVFFLPKQWVEYFICAVVEAIFKDSLWVRWFWPDLSRQRMKNVLYYRMQIG